MYAWPHGTFVQSVFHVRLHVVSKSAWTQTCCGGVYKPHPVKGNPFGIALNVADPSGGRATGVEVDRDLKSGSAVTHAVPEA